MSAETSDTDKWRIGGKADKLETSPSGKKKTKIIDKGTKHNIIKRMEIEGGVNYAKNVTGNW